MLSPSCIHFTPRKRAISSNTPRPTILFLECSMPSTERPREFDQLGVVTVVGLVLVEDVPERVPVRGALHAQGQGVVGIADLVPVLLAGDGVGAGGQHLMDRIEASAEQAGLGAGAIERNAKRKHLAGSDQARRLHDVLGCNMVEGADLIFLAPASPVFEFLRGFGDRLFADLDVHEAFLPVFRYLAGALASNICSLDAILRWSAVFHQAGAALAL